MGFIETRPEKSTRSPSRISTWPSIGSSGENATRSRPFSLVTFNAPWGSAFTKPPVPLTGNQYSVQVSAECGAKPVCLKGVRVLSPAAWLNSRPDCTSTYWPSWSLSSPSQIIPWRDSPQIHAFFPSFSSRAAYRPIPKSSSCQYPP